MVLHFEKVHVQQRLRAMLHDIIYQIAPHRG